VTQDERNAHEKDDEHQEAFVSELERWRSRVEAGNSTHAVSASTGFGAEMSPSGPKPPAIPRYRRGYTPRARGTECRVYEISRSCCACWRCS
jgi:hypothetical protein